MIDAAHRKVLSEIDLGWINLSLVVGDDYIQIKDETLPDDFNTGRKWRISAFMTTSEVVQTAFAALMAWWEHEAREAFTYKGQAIFGPHLDVEALHAFVSAGNFEYREAMA